MEAPLLTRRALLGSVAASAVVAALPVVPLVALSAEPVAPVLQAFVVGTPGEFDWHSYLARSAEEAFGYWVEERGEDYDWTFDPDYVQRVEAWDGRDPGSITPADWLRVNLGHCCERCGYETHADAGARIVCEEVVCDDCLTFADIVATDADEAFDEILNRLDDEGEEETKAWLEVKKCWDAVKDDLWPRAIAKLAEVAA